MSKDHLSRRGANQLIISAAAAACLGSGALAQPFDKDKDKKKQPAGKQPNNRQPAAAPALDTSGILKPGKDHDWTLKGEVNVSAYVRPPRDRKKELPEVQNFSFTSAAVVFPLLRGSGSHRMYDQELKSELRFDEKVVAEKPGEMLQGSFPSGTRLGRWDMRAPEGEKMSGRDMKLEVEISMTSWRTIFDEKTAELVPWPSGPWSAVAASTFADVQQIGDASQAPPLIYHTSEVAQSLVKRWCNNRDPKSQPPSVLAKWLASNVLEHIQTSGDGLNFADNGMFEGMEMKGSEYALTQGKGTDQDVTCALAAIYRAAGLPARTVIGFDVLDDKGSKDSFLKRRRDVPAFRSWVEFCLYDERARREIWVPVDVNRQRKKSSRILNNMKAWQYFGSNDELEMVCPFAFQFHPPTSVIAHGSVSFWGWITFGDEAPKASQYLRFNANTTARKKDTDQKRREADEEEKKQPRRK